MPKPIMVDSGPCIALFNRDDHYHDQAKQFIKRTKAELMTNLAVVTETMYVLDFSLQAQSDFLTWVEAGALTLVEPQEADFERTRDLMAKYADLPMDFTDALLVANCERLETKRVASVDHHFSIYRYRSRGVFVNEFFES